MKSSKKALALALAAAMAITGIPVTDAGAATTAKLSATKATIYVGGSKTVSVSTPKSWKNVKVTVSSTKKSVATAKKTSAKKFKVTAVKAGTAKVKVKVTYKKSSKKGAKRYTKNYSTVLTIKNPSITLNTSSVTLKVGETAPVNVTKKSPSSLVVKYTSEDPAIASVSKGTITAISAGTTNIVVSGTYGKKTVTKKVKVTVTAAEDGITTVLTNQLNATDYPNTVLVSDPAIINVTYTKDGKPVQGQTLVISKDNENPGTGKHGDYEFENTAVTTNASGVATFVIKNRFSNVKMSSTGEVASVNYRIQLANATTDTGTQAVKGTVNFAAISVSNIYNTNTYKDEDFTPNTTKAENLVPGTNFKDIYGDNDSVWTRWYSTNTDQTWTYAQYVASQQVSAKGTTEHQVTMNGGYPVITLPGTASEATTTKGSQEINYTSGAYKTYTNNEQIFKLEKDPKKLSYATLNFKDVSISKYTALEVYAYATEDAANKDKDRYNDDEDGDGEKDSTAPFDRHIYDGELTQAAFGYQIPFNKIGDAKGVWIVVRIVSKGQVQDGKNNGYTASTIDYVYKNPEGTDGKTELYKDGKVTWKQVDTPYTAETAVNSLADVNGAHIPDTLQTGEAGPIVQGFKFNDYKYTVKFPVFPYTGNAIITKKDKNDKVLAYYSAPTVDNDKNQNKIENQVHAYQISADEIKDTPATLTQTDKTVTINSEIAGRTTLEGVVTINGKELAEADLAHVYTSVQWNPIPKADATSKHYVALLGQKITVIGQLVDKNGNIVSKSGETVEFYAKGKKLVAGDTLTSADDSKAYGKATVVDVKSNTDSQGQAKAVLKASEITTLTSVKADTSAKEYDVVLSIVKDETAESADLSWADANLVFEDKVSGTVTTTTAAKDYVSTDNDSFVSEGVSATPDTKPEVGTSWFYGTRVTGQFYNPTSNTAEAITINGIDTGISKTAESVGSLEVADGAAKVTSTKSGPMDIEAKINSTTGTATATIDKTGFAFAGTGAPSIDKKLTINVHWQTKGITASYIVPTGTRVTTGASLVTYIRVQDSLGNPIKGKPVTFSEDSTNASIDTANTDAVTDANTGIAKVTLNLIAASINVNDTVTVTAKIDNDTFDQTFTFIAERQPLAIKNTKNQETKQYLTKFDKEAKKVTLTFNDEIVTESVSKEVFNKKVQIGAGYYAITDITVNGNVVTLKLADVPSSVAENDNVVVTVVSNAADEENVKRTLTSVNGMKYTKTTITINGNNAVDPTEA